MRTLRDMIKFVINAHINLAERFKDMDKNDPYWKGRHDGFREFAARLNEILEQYQ